MKKKCPSKSQTNASLIYKCNLNFRNKTDSPAQEQNMSVSTIHYIHTAQDKREVLPPILSQFTSSKTTSTCSSHSQTCCSLLCILNACIPLTFSQNTSLSYASTKHQLSSPLFLGSNMHRIHDETNIFCNLLCSHCMLLKFCFYCWLRYTFLYTKGSPILAAGRTTLTKLLLPV